MNGKAEAGTSSCDVCGHAEQQYPRTRFRRLLPTVSLIRSVGVGTLAGLIAGVLVLGISGRIAMRVVALAGGEEPSFTVVGTLAVLAAFGLLSAPLGLAFVAWSRYLPRAGVWGGAGFGVVLFILVAGLTIVRRGGVGDLANRLVSRIALVGGLLVLHGVGLSIATAWVEQWLPAPNRSVRSILGLGSLLLIAVFGLVMWAAFVFDPGE